MVACAEQDLLSEMEVLILARAAAQPGCPRLTPRDFLISRAVGIGSPAPGFPGSFQLSGHPKIAGRETDLP